MQTYFYYFTKETNEWDASYMKLLVTKSTKKIQYLAELARLDIAMIPIINQVTYIGCNTQNLEFLYRIVKKCLMKLFCKGSSVQIQPYVINNDGDNTTATAT
ncbi:hypothetical protein CRE_17950 [Caenorhabditis remanei]|uniref:Uncharacterized protein n=1 Tax=Caenorhabditis remanei TaxID=31234 RepID=E3MDQ9_CAERE|nr:hypothetical protein CRE_17950 [Caenorhabditis remanei]